MYVSLLGISGALYLSVFEQPASRVFSSTLPVPCLAFLEYHKVHPLLALPVIGTLLLLIDFSDLFHHPIEVIDQPVMIHEHLAAGGCQQERGYDRLFQRQIDFPFFVRKNRKEQLELGFEIIGSLFVVCNGYRQELDVLR
jgi:hypothetical protein